MFISGASRGIGLAIALAVARDGANIALTAKTAEPHPKLEGTIYTAAEEIERAGGTALPIVGDIRDEAQVEAAIAQAVERFGGIGGCADAGACARAAGSCVARPTTPCCAAGATSISARSAATWSARCTSQPSGKPYATWPR